jgi:hypothetical protein
MPIPFTRFLKIVLLFVIPVYLLLYVYNQYAPLAFKTNAGELLLAYFTATTILSYYILSKAGSKNPQDFVMYYLAKLTVKFLSALGILLIYIVLYKKLTYGFSFVFLFLFLLFTIFELTFFLKWFKK